MTYYPPDTPYERGRLVDAGYGTGQDVRVAGARGGDGEVPVVNMTIMELRQRCEELEAEGKGDYRVMVHEYERATESWEWEEVMDDYVSDSDKEVRLTL